MDKQFAKQFEYYIRPNSTRGNYTIAVYYTGGEKPTLLTFLHTTRKSDVKKTVKRYLNGLFQTSKVFFVGGTPMMTCTFETHFMIDRVGVYVYDNIHKISDYYVYFGEQFEVYSADTTHSKHSTLDSAINMAKNLCYEAVYHYVNNGNIS